MNDQHSEDLQRKIYRYHFFTIWSSGFPYIDEILADLRKEKEIEILRIESYSFKDMRRFVFDLYACDSVPIWHLESKLRYLYKLPPRVINVFVRNFNPQEEPAGQGEFRKKQCKYIVQIKNKIRNKYNPRHKDPDFHIAPLDQGVSHEHVIHASDREEQVDYYLKLLGHKDGIAFLKNDDEGLFFEKPYHIRRPRQYTFQRIPISSILADIHVSDNGRCSRQLTAVKDTPHYNALCSDMNIYTNHLNQFRFTHLCDDYSIGKFLALKEIKVEQLRRLPPIIVKPLGTGFYQILDGVHRAAVHLFRGFETIPSVVFEQW
jgi:hypothetical protein